MLPAGVNDPAVAPAEVSANPCLHNMDIKTLPSKLQQVSEQPKQTSELPSETVTASTAARPAESSAQQSQGVQVLPTELRQQQQQQQQQTGQAVSELALKATFRVPAAASAESCSKHSKMPPSALQQQQSAVLGQQGAQLASESVSTGSVPATETCAESFTGHVEVQPCTLQQQQHQQEQPAASEQPLRASLPSESVSTSSTRVAASVESCSEHSQLQDTLQVLPALAALQQDVQLTAGSSMLDMQSEEFCEEYRQKVGESSAAALSLQQQQQQQQQQTMLTVKVSTSAKASDSIGWT
jgi:hypothetical protein